MIWDSFLKKLLTMMLMLMLMITMMVVMLILRWLLDTRPAASYVCSAWGTRGGRASQGALTVPYA